MPVCNDNIYYIREITALHFEECQLFAMLVFIKWWFLFVIKLDQP